MDATRSLALDAALQLLQEEGILAVTHGAVSSRTGISRSTLYRHWPKVDALRNAAFARAATGELEAQPTDGTMKADLMWMLGYLVKALNETPWGKIAPQVIGAAATDEETRALLNKWMEDRGKNVASVFAAAKERGELRDDAPVQHLIETAIAGPYFRKLVAGRELDQAWLETHVDMICFQATGMPKSQGST